MIRFYLQPNPVTPDPNDQSARIRTTDTLTMDDIVKRAVNRGTSFTETDLAGAGQLLFEVISDEVANGSSVNLPLVNIRPSIKGVFTSAADSFDASRHIKRATVTAGLLLNSKMQSAKVEKVTGDLPSPVLLEYSDVNSGTTNSLLTPGGIGVIIGEELKFDNTNPAEGIFFIPESGGAAVQVTVLALRTEGKLMFNIPLAAQLPSGNYTLEVRKGYGNSVAIRSGSLKDTLTVS